MDAKTLDAKTLPKPLGQLIAAVAELDAALKAKHTKSVIAAALDEAEKAWKVAMKANLAASRVNDATFGQAYADALNAANFLIADGRHASR